MNPGIRLRLGKPQDIEAMYRLDLLCFDKPFRFDLRVMRRYASEPEAIVVVAECGQTMVGFVIVSLRHRGALTAAYITTLDVHPAHRRSGLARQLTAKAEMRAVAAQATQCALHVASGNVDAICFYEAIGYARTGQVADYYGPGVDAWVYGKALL